MAMDFSRARQLLADAELSSDVRRATELVAEATLQVISKLEAHQKHEVTKEATDSRPEGWTDRRAMEFVGAKYQDVETLSVERVAFMRHFLKGEWAVVNKYFPEFQQWLSKKGGK